jgi:branched-chain amino acid transport system substrate-binding protein
VKGAVNVLSRRKCGWTALVAASLVVTACSSSGSDSGSSASGVQTYNVAEMADFTGPFAALFKDWQPAREAVFRWWNATEGAKLKIKLVGHSYDTHYDTATTASLWPSVLSSIHPLLAEADGGPTTAALSARLPKDKVPLIGSGGGYGFDWKPEGWIVYPKPTLIHEAAGCISWLEAKLGHKVRVAEITNKQTPTFADLSDGLAHYAETSGKAEVVSSQSIPLTTTDLTSTVTQIVAKNPDVIVVFTSSAQAAGAIKAVKGLGKDIPVAVAQHDSLASVIQALGSASPVIGSYECSYESPAVPGSSAEKYYKLLKDKYALTANFNSGTVLGLSQALLTVYAIQAAAEAADGAKITGSDVQQAIKSMKLSSDQLQGIFPSGWQIDAAEAPFPTQDLKIDIATVGADGSLKLAAEGVPVPELTKWANS